MAARRKRRSSRAGGGAARRRRRLRPVALVIAVLTAAALVWWGIVTTDAGIGRFWSEPEHGEAGPHGDVTDAEREELRKVLEQIDREKSAE